MKKGIDTAPYKGVRDFYPEEMFLQKYLFDKMRKTVESFGFVEYGASILEPAELYKAKSGEEIINDQTYTFTDRGDREVTLRPEMTPTIARMIAAKRRELPLPIKWYSIPNLFRYERPQRGRLREHFQLNVDLFGIAEVEAEVEIIKVASELLLNLGAKDTDFEIRINNRELTNVFLDKFKLSAEEKLKVSKAIDKKNKISKESFKEALQIILNDKTDEFISILESNKKLVEFLGEESTEIKKLTKFIDTLLEAGIKNVVFDQCLMRGFDYYTGFVFEIFDTNPENRRSLFGGGRFDKLRQIFDAEDLPAVGFGAGDVTLADFMEAHHLLPSYRSPIDLYICTLDGGNTAVNNLSTTLRKNGVNIFVDSTGRKIGDEIKSALKQQIPFFLCVGEKEAANGKFVLKNLVETKEITLKEEEIADFIRESRNKTRRLEIKEG